MRYTYVIRDGMKNEVKGLEAGNNGVKRRGTPRCGPAKLLAPLTSNIDESIVLIGGGGGVYRVARFLKHIRKNITTIQTMFDHGGHSGSLRDERGVLPPGDIRQAILALSDDEIESELRALLSHRFVQKGGSSLDSATVGNILLTALTEITGNTVSAINTLCRWFHVAGKVLPVSLDHSDLCVRLSDGSVMRGEGLIDKRSIKDNRSIKSAFLEPDAYLYTGAHDAIVQADKIVFCPGDLYTSVIPNVLTKGFRDAIGQSDAKLIDVVNIMTKKAETHDFSTSRFAETLLGYVGRDRFDAVICNSARIRPKIASLYRAERAFPVVMDTGRLRQYADIIIAEDVADQTNQIVRHSGRVASIIASL
jgi:uncharacterized cofD-like protein